MMKSLSNRLNKIASRLPFDPKYWIEKNRHLVEQGNRQVWKELSDEEFELVSDYIDEHDGNAGEKFNYDLSSLTDEQFDEFDRLTDEGMELTTAYQACLTTI